MNKQECDILNVLKQNSYRNQRELAENSGHSLGVVNRSVKSLIQKGFVDDEMKLTEKAIEHFNKTNPKNAIILAAGFGMRMVPINTESPKGLLEIDGEPLVERLIKQLQDVGITDIYIVVGFMKEAYEYLIDEYNVELIVNAEYAAKNNIHSLKRAMKHLSNSYIVPSDIWCARNPFKENELYSWYMVSDEICNDSSVRINRKEELVVIPEDVDGNTMIGISYLTADDAETVKKRLIELCADSRNDGAFWEETLYKNDKMIIAANVVRASEVIEINTYEQLRELDGDSKQLQNEAITMLMQSMNVDEDEVTNITVLKKGMTNRSFLFTANNQKYIMRVPGEGTEKLINREEEASVYDTIKKEKISDKVIFFDSQKGYKITEYWENARCCDPLNEEDLKKCMKKLREFHAKKLSVDHEFNIFEKLEFYESLWDGKKSVYRDYLNTKKNVYSLSSFIDKHIEEKVLTHVDAVPDNFLFVNNLDEEEVRLIDWEYAAMQDPHVDIAMFCIYSLYDRSEVERLIDIYFEGNCTKENRVKIYCYIAACGLLWSNWCEYKRNLGVEFGEYSLRQYRYAKDYYKIAKQEIEMMEV